MLAGRQAAWSLLAGIFITIREDLGEEKGIVAKEECEQRSREKQHGRSNNKWLPKQEVKKGQSRRETKG